MKTQNSIYAALPVLFGFFVMGFCDIVGISSDYVQRTFNWSPVMTGKGGETMRVKVRSV